MKIIVAHSAGFCFGVNRAVKMVNELLDQGKKVCTLGPIIHNPQTLAQLASRGVTIVESPDGVPPDSTMVIRSHGVSKAVYDSLLEKKADFVNATCPFVAKIHNIVSKASAEGKTVLIAGDAHHPEVEGIRGHCTGKCYVFKNAGELQNILEHFPVAQEDSPCVVAQTTFSVSEWENCLEMLKRVYTNATIFDTICNATAKRQSEAEFLSRQCDVMIVIGGRESSNTAKLRDVCMKNCTTYLIETADELPLSVLKESECIGITAGASTPASIIKEVLDTMSEINEGAG